MAEWKKKDVSALKNVTSVLQLWKAQLEKERNDTIDTLKDLLEISKKEQDGK